MAGEALVYKGIQFRTRPSNRAKQQQQQQSRHSNRHEQQQHRQQQRHHQRHDSSQDQRHSLSALRRRDCNMGSWSGPSNTTTISPNSSLTSPPRKARVLILLCICLFPDKCFLFLIHQQSVPPALHSCVNPEPTRKTRALGLADCSRQEQQKRDIELSSMLGILPRALVSPMRVSVRFNWLASLCNETKIARKNEAPT